MFSSFFGSKDQSGPAGEALMVDEDHGDHGGHHINPIHPKGSAAHHAPVHLKAYPDEEDNKHEIFSDVRDPEGIHYSHLTKNDDGSVGAPMSSCYFTLANTIMGSGMLGLPYAFSRTGWVLGTILILCSATSSAFALHLLSCCALKLPYPSSFYKVANTAMPGFEKVIDLAVVIKCFGVATSYLIVIGGLMPDVVDEIYGSSSNASRRFWESRLVWVVVGFVIVTPLSYLKNLSALKYTSFLSICFVVFLMVLVVLFSADIGGLDPCATDDDGGDGNDDLCVGKKANFILNMDSMKVLSIFVFGFTCHQNMFTIVNELDAVSKPRLNQVVLASVGTALCIYMVVATSGYNTYGDQVESNILKSYPKMPLIAIARIFTSLLVCFTYPLQCNPARRCVLTLLASIMRDAEQPPETLEHILAVRYLLVTACFLGLSLLIALAVSDLGVMLSLVGATGSTLVSYILPGFCYYFLFQGEGPAWKRQLALLQGCTGLVIIPVCLTFIFL